MSTISTLSPATIDSEILDLADATTISLPAFAQRGPVPKPILVQPTTPLPSTRLGFLESMSPGRFDGWFCATIERHGFYLVAIQVLAVGIDRRVWSQRDRELVLVWLRDRLSKQEEPCQNR